MPPRMNTGPTSRVASFFLGALAALLVIVVFGQVSFAWTGVDLRLPYKIAERALVLLWIGCLAFPFGRTTLPYRFRPPDLALVLFALAAALSVLLGGGHWGDVRNLLAAIAIGWLARTLFGAPHRRGLLLHYLGGTVVLILVRELIAQPDLLLLREHNRYGLVTGNPNMLGFLFAMTSPLFLAAALGAHRARRRAAGLYFPAAVLGVLLTFSRTAAFGLALGAVITALGLERRGRALAWGALALALFLALQRPDLWTGERRPGDADRPRIVRTSLSLFSDAPILGIGFGINNIEERFPARYEALYGARLFRFHSANQLVDLLVGTGIIGTALALWWAAWVGRDALSRRRSAHGRPARIHAAGQLAALATIAAMSFAEPPLYHGKLLPILFLVLACTELPANEDE